MTDAATPASNTTPAQAEVLNYLNQHHINDQLNVIVNKLVKAQPSDPFAFLAREFQQKANPAAITKLVGREILDSRGNPTVECDVYGRIYGEERLLARAGAPSGASTGSNEAHELRDSDRKDRYLGKGTTIAANNISTALSAAVANQRLNDFRALDDLLQRADGTQLKTKLGGNAITAASFALAEAGAVATNEEIFLYLTQAYHGQGKIPNKFTLPRPMVNILNGGKHAGGELQIQEFMIVPRARPEAGGFRENLRMVTEVYHHLGKLLVKKKGVSAKNLGDEGGYAPALSSPDEALLLIEEAIQLAGNLSKILITPCQIPLVNLLTSTVQLIIICFVAANRLPS
jgi:enolase